MASYKVYYGDVIDVIEADTMVDAIRQSYAGPLTSDQMESLEIEGNVYSGADWDVCVEDSDGAKEYFFVTYEE